MTLDAREVRSRLNDPWALVSALGLVTDRRGWKRQSRGVTVRCPWHDEKTPSCSVSLGADGTVRVSCFGCKHTSDALGLIAAVYRLDVRRDFRDVMKIACDLAGIEVDDVRGVYVLPPVRPAPPDPERLDDDVFAAIADLIEARCPLVAQRDVCGYLRERGLLEAARGSLCALPASSQALNDLRAAIVAEVGDDAWQRSGLARRDGGWVFAEHRLVAFWREPGTTCPATTIQRRLIRDPRDGESKYVFATRRSPRHPYGIEHAEALGPGGEVCFVEGVLDTLALRTLCARQGVDRLVLGLPGTSGWAQPWAKLTAGRVAVVATDSDDAGERAAERIATDCLAAGALDVVRSEPDGAKDWSELLEQRREVAA